MVGLPGIKNLSSTENSPILTLTDQSAQKLGQNENLRNTLATLSKPDMFKRDIFFI